VNWSATLSWEFPSYRQLDFDFASEVICFLKAQYGSNINFSFFQKESGMEKILGRREFIGIAGLAGGAGMLAACGSADTATRAVKEVAATPVPVVSELNKGLSFLVFVGTYTENASPAGEKSEGIYVYRMEPKEGALTLLQVMRGIVNPSFLAIHPNGRFLYAVNEVGQFDSQPGGGVSAFSIGSQAGELGLLNQQLSRGADPCYVSVDATGKVVLVANYSGGSLSMLPVDPDGKLLPASDVDQHYGSGQDPLRQEGPHVHSVIPSPDNRFAIVADLGLDQVMVYQLDLGEEKLVLQTNLMVQAKAGSGPRHLEFHPNGRFVYLINELDSTLTAFDYNPGDGMLREIQTVPTLPDGFRGDNITADVHVSPSGKFVYGSNRGHDSIVIYAVDGDSGRLTYIGHEPTGGNYPRNFAIDPTGTYMLVANQNSGSIVPFWMDKQTGKLSPTGKVTQVPTPVCIKFLQEA
jgi:6-phosphogluconolactonase